MILRYTQNDRNDSMKIVVLDNYDSFTYNLVHLVEKILQQDIAVKRNDKISLEEVAAYDKIILSPGPGLPSEAGIMPELIKKYASTKSILGVCLGMQAIAEAFGGTLSNLGKVYHGVAMPVNIEKEDVLFTYCPKTFSTGRYHSWVVSETDFPAVLEVTAKDKNNNIMALRHKTYDVRGVQFHPESILTEYGEEMMRGWLEISKYKVV